MRNGRATGRTGFGLAPLAVAVALLTASSAHAQCTGDCDGDGMVVVNELIIGVNIALGNTPLGNCPSFDSDGSGSIEINELIRAVTNALNACGTLPTPTPTPTPSSSGTPTVEAPLSVVGIASRTMGTLLEVPQVLSAIAIGVRIATEAEKLDGTIVPCPLGGSVSASIVPGGLEVNLNGCIVPTADGRRIMTGRGAVYPTFVSANVIITYGTASGQTLRRGATNIGFDGVPQLGGSCVLTGLTMSARGSAAAGDTAEHNHTIGFDRTSVGLEALRFDSDCLLQGYRLTVSGFANGYVGTSVIEANAVDLRLDVDLGSGGTRVTMSGGIDAPCLGGLVQLQSTNLVIPYDSLCPANGTVDAGTPTFTYELGGAVDFDADGDGVPDVLTVPHCYDATALACP